MPDYRQAFSALDSGRYDVALGAANRGPDVVLDEVLRGYLMARPGNDFSFSELSGFITDHPDWPGLNGIVMIAEQKIPSNAGAEQVAEWFNAHPPLTVTGFYRYVDALYSLGRNESVPTMVKNRWINHEFSESELMAFESRYSPLLTPADHKARLDRLLWANDITAARAMYRFVDAGEKSVAEARIALANQLKNAGTILAKVPPQLQNDSGLLYERLRWQIKNNNDDTAAEILQNPPERLGKPEAWWDERNVVVRRLMERHDYKTAYQLASNHGLTSGFDYVQAEFLAGWLALRFLDRPDLARPHFEALLEQANTPMSRARGEYWLGRTLEASGDKSEAEQSYESAAALNTTFYGQLAATRIYANPTIATSPEPLIPANVRSQFLSRDVIMATEKLARIGQTDRAHCFFKAAQDYATQRVEFVLLMELAYKLQRPDWVIQTAKAASQKNMLVAASAFPVLSLKMPERPDPAFTHALIRQESLFNTDAGSPVGARGLMQLMPHTAKETAKKLGVPYKAYRLTEPDYNIKLGAAFVQEQIDGFNGSLILALAGYNAGPHRAREWIAEFGDPRSKDVDAVDWIESIPIYETRNYVQRIIENLQFYRARLNGGHAPLLIAEDIKR